MNLKKYIGTIHDYPKKGVIFRDINTLLKNPLAFKELIDSLIDIVKKLNIEVIAAAGARGFIIGAPIAYSLGIKFVAIRKTNKLPSKVYSTKYTTEYSTEILQMQENVINEKERVLIIDDLLATGGTMLAMAKLIGKSKGIVVGAAFAININLPILKKIKFDFPIYSIINY